MDKSKTTTKRIAFGLLVLGAAALPFSAWIHLAMISRAFAQNRMPVVFDTVRFYGPMVLIMVLDFIFYRKEAYAKSAVLSGVVITSNLIYVALVTFI